MRVSSVGKVSEGRRIPPDRGGVVDEFQPHQRVDDAAVARPGLEARRQAGAGQVVEDADPVGGEAGVAALPEGRGSGEREQVRQEVGRLVHQVDPGLVVGDADMDMHAADQHPVAHIGEIAAELVVARAVAAGLGGPRGGRVAGGGDRRQAVALRHPGHRAAQADELAARLAGAAADAGADLDLAAEIFRRHPVADRLGAFVDHRLGGLGEIEAFGIDEEIFLLDPDGEVVVWHRAHSSRGVGPARTGRGGNDGPEARAQSMALKLNSPPSLMPENQRSVTVFVRV